MKRKVYPIESIRFIKKYYGILTSLKLSEELGLKHGEVKHIIETHNIKSKRYTYTLSPEDKFYNMKFRAYQYSAKLKNREFDLTIDEFKDITKNNCNYCNESAKLLSIPKNRKTTMVPIVFNGIDRIDSSKGYTPTNCVACCTICNEMKMDRTVEQFQEHVKKIMKTMEK